MRRSVLLLAALAAASPALADTPLHPHLDESTPRIVPADHSGTLGISFQGAELEPTEAQAGVAQFYMNTHAWEFYQLELRVETDGRVGPVVVCSTAPGAFGRGCSISTHGTSGMSVELNPFTVPGWRTGVRLQAVAQVMLHGAVYRSNLFVIPFARGLGTPVVTGLSRTAFPSGGSDWSLRLTASALDLTANVRFDGASFADGAVSAGSDGHGAITVKVPPAARSVGHHSVQVCGWALGAYGPGENAVCSAPANYDVTMEMRRMPGLIQSPAMVPRAPVGRVGG